MKWKYLKALNDLFVHRQTSVNIESQKDEEGQFIKRRLIDGLYIIQKRPLKTPIWIPCNGFDEYYEKHFKYNFDEYETFLKENYIPYSAIQTYKEKDIRRLFLIKGQRQQILEKKPSEKEFLYEFLDEEAKYFLGENVSLKKAILKILGINTFEGEDSKVNQWRFVVDCPNAKCVVLCENKDRLTLTKRPLENLIELWHVGGNNTPPLERLEGKLALPIFYACDWDRNGLEIFSRIKKIIENIGGKVHLLIPPHEAKRFPTISKNHKSDWFYNKDFSGLNRQDFSIEAQNIIQELILQNKYIQEEGNDLVEMINSFLG